MVPSKSAFGLEEEAMTSVPVKQCLNATPSLLSRAEGDDDIYI